MKRILYHILLVIISCTFGIQLTHAQKVQVEAELDSVQIWVGEQTGLHLGVIIKDGQRVQFPQFQPQQQLIPGVEVVETLPSDTTDAKDGFIKVTAHYVLTSFDDTLYYLPPLPVKVDGKEYKSKNLALKVLTIEVDTLHPNQFFPPKDVQDNPFLLSEWTRLLWFLLVVMLCSLAVFYMYRRLKSNKPIVLSVRIIKRVPPHQKALNSIEEIKTHSVTDTPEDAKLYYTQLTDALRRYMMERFGFNAMEMTSAEIIARLRQEDDQQKISELTMLFETADLVKFAKHSTDVSENDRNLVNAVDFINNTKLEGQPTEERVLPTATEEQRQTIRARISLKWGIGILSAVAIVTTIYLIYQLFLLLY